MVKPDFCIVINLKIAFFIPKNHGTLVDLYHKVSAACRPCTRQCRRYSKRKLQHHFGGTSLNTEVATIVNQQKLVIQRVIRWNGSVCRSELMRVGGRAIK